MNLMKETLLKLKSGQNKTAIIDQEGTHLSYEDFYARTVTSSAFFKDRGINKDSKVLLLLPQDTELYTTIASLFQLGATIILVDPWAKSDYLSQALSQVSPDFVILTKKARIFFTKKAIRQIPKRLYTEDLKMRDPENKFEKIIEVAQDHSALITFTSGTTGSPKGFDRSHEFLKTQQMAHEKYFKHDPSDRDLTMYPVFVLSNLKSMMTTVLLNANLREIKKLSPKKLHTQILNHHVNSLCLSPAILEKYISYLEDNELKISVEKLFTGGGPVSLDLCQRVLALNENSEAFIVYGSTEAEPISLISFKEALKNKKSSDHAFPVGRIVEGHRYKLCELEEKIHPFHQVIPKELHLTGSFVGKKYWNNEKAFHESKYLDLEGNIWHKTGDILFQDEDNLFILGRVNDLIRTDAGIIFPLILETKLNEKFGLKRCCYQKINTDFILFYQGELNEEIQSFMDEAHIPLTKKIPVEGLPLDERHQTKINRNKIKNDYIKGNLMIDESSPLLKKLMAYTKERFPLIPILLFVALLTLSSANLFTHIYSGMELSFKNPLLYSSIFTLFLFMLQLRLSDEIKDFEKDKMAYPERILSRGLISVRSIETSLYFLIGTSLLLNFFMGMKFFIMISIIQLYALLMKEEFFCRKFLEKRLGLYLISHQLIIPLLCLYASMTVLKPSDLSYGSALIYTLVFLTLPSTLYEIARKTWSPDKEKEHADSYTRFWGIGRTVWVLISLLLIMTWCCKLVPVNFNIYYLSIFFGMNFLMLMALSLFKARPTNKNSKYLELSGSLYLLLIHAINTFMIF